MRETSATARDHIDVAWHAELQNLYFFHPSVLDFPPHAHARDDSHAHTHLHEAFDALDGGHLDRHIQFGAMAGEKFNHAAAEGAFHAVRDENLFGQFRDIDLAFFG